MPTALACTPSIVCRPFAVQREPPRNGRNFHGVEKDYHGTEVFGQSLRGIPRAAAFRTGDLFEADAVGGQSANPQVRCARRRLRMCRPLRGHDGTTLSGDTRPLQCHRGPCAGFVRKALCHCLPGWPGSLFLLVVVVPVGGKHKDEHFRAVYLIHQAVLLGDGAGPLSGAVA